MRKMKKILFALSLCLTASLLLASCQENIDQPVFEKGQIVFGVEGVGASVATKAYGENTAAQLQANGFKVAGVTSANSVMFNAVASYASGVYSPAGGPYYFPASGTMSFFAAYPQDRTVDVDASGAATLSWSHDPDVDLLAAKNVGVSATSSSVALTFDHVLTLLKFKAEGTDASVVYKVKNITVRVPGSGVYSFADNAWTAGGTNVSQVYSDAVTTLSGVTDIDGAVTVVPCTPIVAVEWDTYASDGTTLIASYSDSKSLGTAVSIGKTATITLKLPNSDSNDITFTVEVNPWGSENHDLVF